MMKIKGWCFYFIWDDLNVSILLTKTCASQNKVALSYRLAKELYFLAIVFAVTIFIYGHISKVRVTLVKIYFRSTSLTYPTII